MGFTGAATTELAATLPRKQGRLFLRTNFAASDEWLEYPLGEWELSEPANEPSQLEATLPDSALAFDAEASETARTQMFGLAIFVECIGDESEVKLYGPITGLRFSGAGCKITCHDWSVLFSWVRGQCQLEPDSVEVIADGAYRELELIQSGDFGQAFGFTPNGSGTDPAFDEATQKRRRPWQFTGWKLYRDNTGTEEVPSRFWQVNHTSGVVSILEDISGNDYWITNVRALKESDATGATNCDFSRLIEQVWTYAPADDTGLNADSGELDIDDTGIDLAGPFVFPLEEAEPGFPAGLSRLLQERVASNFRAWYDSSGISIDFGTLLTSGTGKFTWKAIAQTPRGDEHWTLPPGGSLSKTRDVEEVWSGVEVTGFAERPSGLLSNPGDITVTPTDLQASAHWCTFDNANNPSNVGFATALPKLYDGDIGMGVILASIPGVSLKDWIDVASWALSREIPVSRIRMVLPGTKNRNPNNQYGDFEGFWPGGQLVGRKNGGSWTPLMAEFIDRPGSRIELSGTQILSPHVDELKWRGRCFKGGINNQNDPWVGLAELEIYFGEKYSVRLLAQGSDSAGVFKYTNNQRHPITAASTAADTFTIAGDWRTRFHPGACFVVEDSTAAVHDGKYTVLDSQLSGSDTVISVALVNSTSASGTIRVAVDSYLPDLLTRLQRHDGTQYHKVFQHDVGDRFNEFLAWDVATQLFDEKTRVFERYAWSGPADARVRRHQTVAPRSGGWRSAPEGFLVEGKTTRFSPAKGQSPASYSCQIVGTDYLSGRISNA